MNYKQELLETILPFWLDNSIDRVNGGIFTQLDAEDLSKNTQNKKPVEISRKNSCVPKKMYV